jgi:predicted ATPase/class 3 adenylate cyclase
MTVTLVFTDLVNSTAIKSKLPGVDIIERNRAYFDKILTPHRQRLWTNLDAYGGRVVDTAGDGCFLVFNDTTRAVNWAIAVQSSHADEPIDTPLGPLQVKIGMHTGAPLQEGDNFIGQEVDYAARVGALANGGQIVVSEAAAALVRAAGIVGIALHPHGERELKGIGRVPVYELLYANRQPQPLKEPSFSMTNLPLSFTPFIGRDVEMADWCDLLLEPTTRLMTLTGFGGMGKTYTARQLAKLCIEKYAEPFPDGVWWVELEEARTGEGMLSRIAYCLPLDLQPEPSIKEQLCKFLSGRQLLLVLDNTEQISDAANAVNELLNVAPRVKCLVTSRRPLHLRAEHLMQVPPMPSSDAVTLFVKRARARQRDFALTNANTPDVTELCRRLEGVPLAIELAASRIAVMGPRDMLDRVDQQLDILKTRAPDLHPRQRALRAAIDWSYDLLTDDDKSLFAQLAVFAGRFSMADAKAVCEAFDVMEGLEELLHHSLLRAETDTTQRRQFFMLESVRAYAQEKLQGFADAGMQVRQQHADYFLQFAQQRIGKLRKRVEEAQSLQEFEAHFDNVRTAMDWTQQQGNRTPSAEFALALGTYLQRKAFYREAARRIEMGLDVVRGLQGESVKLRADLLRERAGLHLDAHEWQQAEKFAQDALGLFEQLSDSQGKADCYNLLGLAAKNQKDFAQARHHYTQALEHFQQFIPSEKKFSFSRTTPLHAGSRTFSAGARRNRHCHRPSQLGRRRI